MARWRHRAHTGQGRIGGRPVKMQDQVAIITGSSKGIGAGIARAFSREGARVVISSRTVDEGEAVARELGSREGRAIYVQCDVTDLASLRNLIDATIAAFGRIDVLVNNAGKSNPYLIEDTTEEEWEFTINTDLRSQFFGCKYAIPHLRETRGCIINLSSIGGMIGFPNQVHYNTAKGATIALTRSLATDLAPYGIRVNAISPGVTDTPDYAAWIESKGGADALLPGILSMIPLGRLGTIEDMGKAAVYLVDATYVTGSTLVVDGGMIKY
jgi:meso-butanediol dehydrogenase/(S,S)-butanediol dehydrogenase/diacetyl reductase